MAYDYNNAALIVQRSMDKYGGAGQLIKKGAAAGEPDAFGDVSPAIPDAIIDGTISPLVDYKRQEIDGERIQSGDSWVYFISVDTVEINMQTTLNGATFRVVSIKRLSSIDDINITTKLQLRK